MKFFKYLFVLLSLILMISCGGDEEEEDWGNGGDGGNSDGNGGWESQEDQDYEILKTSGFTYIHSLVIGSNDTLYVGGTAQEESKKSDAFLVAFDTKGKELWSEQWDYQESADTVNYIATDKYGNIYVNGATDSGHVPFVIKFAPDGTKIWEQFLNFEGIARMTSDPEGNIYILKTSSTFIAKYPNDGKELWSNDVVKTDESIITTIVVDSEQNIYVGGETYENLFAENAGKKDAFLVKLAPNGTQLWGKQWGNDGNNGVITISLGNNDDIFVISSSGDDYLTQLFFKFSTDATQIWEIKQNCLSLTTCNDNNIYCVSKNSHAISKYNLDGKYLGSSSEFEKTIGSLHCNSKGELLTRSETNIIRISSSEIK